MENYQCKKYAKNAKIVKTENKTLSLTESLKPLNYLQSFYTGT